MQLVQTLRLILTLLPLIIEAVRAIEAALPDGGKGEAKLALVRQSIEAGYAVATDTAAAFETMWPALEKTVAAVVALFNSVGAFRKT